jgi:hypothetical protein
MASNNYHFVTHWRVRATKEEVAEILTDAPGLVRWWPSVYLDIQQIERGDEHGLNSAYRLHTKGWLPYNLHWQYKVTNSDYPHTWTLVASGDFEGRGIWTLEQDGPWVNVTYDWKIRADKPLLRYLSFIFKPIFRANHIWAMKKGEESLVLELVRRKSSTPEERARIPEPPGPTWPTPKRKQG